MTSKNTTQNLKSISSEALDWAVIQKDMKNKLGSDIYESWLRKIDFVEEMNSYVLLSVSTRFIRDWITSRYLDQILQIVKTHKKDLTRIEFKIIEKNSENEIEIAAKKGMADEFVRDLPSGYKTQLGTWFKDGKELSGGQWQKVALSRAFMRSKADILILDEPTAAIDAKAEADIFAHFAELTANRISIIISHRFSTVRRADHIIVLEKSKIMEQGSHEELLELGGQYATLFKLQAEGYQ